MTEEPIILNFTPPSGPFAHQLFTIVTEEFRSEKGAQNHQPSAQIILAIGEVFSTILSAEWTLFWLWKTVAYFAARDLVIRAPQQEKLVLTPP